MLFEAFNIVINYRGVPCEVDIRELYNDEHSRSFEVIQGGISILVLVFEQGKWRMCVIDDLHPIVKQDVKEFVSPELIELLINVIVAHYDCFTDRKILKDSN